MMIAGRAGGKILPGRELEYNGGNSEGVYLSIMEKLNLPMSDIGGIDTAIPIT